VSAPLLRVSNSPGNPGNLLEYFPPRNLENLLEIFSLLEIVQHCSTICHYCNGQLLYLEGVKHLCIESPVETFHSKPGPKFTDDLRTILRQFSDLNDNLRTTGEFTEHLRQS